MKQLNLGAVNICSGKAIKVEDLVKNIVSKENKKIKLNLGALPDREHEPKEFWGDNTYLKSILKLDN